MDLGLSGRVALVTGASEGIGFAVARGLAREAARVTLCARRPEVLQRALETLHAESPDADVRAEVADVTRPADVERLVRGVEQAHGPVAVLVNAVGFGFRRAFLDVSDDDWSLVLDSSLLGSARVTRAVLPTMVAAGWGRVVNVGAVSGRQPTRGQAASNAAKAALISLTKSVSLEVAERGVTVNAVLPGRVLSERVRREFDDAGLERRSREVPMRRHGSPEEVADAVLFLASERAAYVTGAALAVDGGLVAAMF